MNGEVPSHERMTHALRGLTHALDLRVQGRIGRSLWATKGVIGPVQIGLGQTIRGLSTLDGFGTDIKRILLSRPWPSMVGLH